MQKMANMYVLAVINNYGMAHLSESVKQTNILKCSETLLKACVTTTTSIDTTKWISSTISLKTLGRLIEKKDYTDCEIENMTWQQKSDLIQKDL